MTIPDDGKILQKSDSRHVIQICTPTSGIHGVLPCVDDLLKSAIPAIPIHALINMYNSSLQDLSVTASRKVPEFAAFWKKEKRIGKMGNVISKEMKQLGADAVPPDVVERLFTMMTDIEGRGEGLSIAEFGQKKVQPDGRRVYEPTGYTINGLPVEKAAVPLVRLMYKNQPQSASRLSDDPYVAQTRRINHLNIH